MSTSQPGIGNPQGNPQQDPTTMLNQRINELEQLLADQTNNRRVTHKPKKPRPYNGKGSPQGFLIQARVYLRQLHLEDETDRILEIVTCLEGEALEWFEPTVKDFLENAEDDREKTTRELFASYANFEERLKDNFDNPDKERAAAQQLMNIRQKGPASKYAVEFRNLMLKANMVDGNDDDILVDMFYRGLKDEVKDEVIRIERPVSLSKYITEAVKIDNRQFERRMEKKGQYAPRQQNKSNQGKKRDNPPTSHGTAPGPMELGGTRQGNNDNIRCYNCNGHGHIARNCKKPKQERKNTRFTPVPEGSSRTNQGSKSFGGVRIRPQVQYGMNQARQLSQAAARQRRQELRTNGELYIWLIERQQWDHTLFEQRTREQLLQQRNKNERRRRCAYRQQIHQAWLQEHQTWDEQLVPGTMEETHHAVHPVNCTKDNCYWHHTEKMLIHSRLLYLHRNGFNFHTRKGPNAADNHWYNELRQHCEDHPAQRGWPQGEGCPQQYPNCEYNECDHQTDDELLERAVARATQRNILDLGFQLAFENNPERKDWLKQQLNEQCQEWHPKGRSLL